MSAGPVTSPIQCLDLDVLWHIFNINADIFDDDTALETTLATSYVCHDWRSLILSSTSIWAHVINLNHWMWNTVEGSRELIRRSGTALPWIKTNIPPRYSRTKRQIPDILDTHWDQIQKLDVTSYNLNDLKNHPPLRRPALHLELLRVRFVGYRGRPEIESASPSLFSGSAPLLRDLRWEGYGLNITAISWLRQVRCMELSSTLTVSAILRVLESTINLTNLHLDSVVADDHALTLPFVSLPKLAHLDLNLSDRLTPGAVLLEHLHITPYCAVIFSAQNIQEGEIDEESTFGPIVAAISACAQHCLAYHLPQRLQIVLKHAFFLLEATDFSRNPYFVLRINMALKRPRRVPANMASQRSNGIPPDMRAAMLHEISKLGLSEVTLFEVKVSRPIHNVPGLATLMECLTSVETLVTEKPFLVCLNNWTLPIRGKPPLRIVFPALKTLRLLSFKLFPKLFYIESNKARDPVSKCVMGRIAWGQVISVVDFTDVTFDVLSNMTFIRKAYGVKVLWRQSNVPGIQEYICGTSPPQKVEGF